MAGRDEDDFRPADALPADRVGKGRDGGQRGVCPESGRSRDSLGHCPVSVILASNGNNLDGFRLAAQIDELCGHARSGTVKQAIAAGCFKGTVTCPRPLAAGVA